MKFSKELLDRAGIVPRLKLGEKNEKGQVITTGPHRVKILEDKTQNGKDKQTGEIIPVVRYIFEENGQRKSYEVPVKDKAGSLHYLVQRFAEFSEGDEVIIEMKRRGIKNYVSVIPANGVDEAEVDDDHLDTMEENED